MAYDPTIGSGQVGRDRNRPRSLNPADQVADAVAALQDSRRGLRTGADLMDDPDASQRLSAMAGRREKYATAIVDVAAGAGIVVGDDVHGKVGEAVRRAWMRVENAMAADDAVLETVMTQERAVAEELAGSVDQGLPVAVERELHNVSSAILDDVDELAGLDITHR